ncbi:SurA N-terminal domain-containing protein [Salinisphaera sp.]|uniref:SurA N-terminal domain-containing protein n=1 Tax=Salinisphaera sp. TaxID=1914330 RepID=UPI000C4E7187|nr:SurA N-terminal domain-containing protein [Salinisphaera sp.]MAS08468.1 hypothetical protein [Salinisphaera sp.]|tara:strand:+ start:405 stop:2336 length:1932 start_codon:yes stop_codon:yes gene_type:complete
MLQRIRDGASGPLAYIVVGIIAVVFGVWGIGSYFTPSSDPTVATAGDTEIKQSQLQRGFDQRYQQLRQVMGDSFDSSVFPPGEVRRSVLQRLIDQAVVTQYAKDNGYRVSDADLLAYIRDNPQFQQDGTFSPARYKQLLAGSGMQPAQYEARLRTALLGDQVGQVIRLGAFAVAPEIDQAYAQANTQRKVSLLYFEPDAFDDGITVSDDDVSAYYNAHKDAFMRPERVKLSYVSLNASTLDTEADTSESALRAIYDDKAASFGTPETRSADMIRVAIDGQDGQSNARQTISQITQQLKQADSPDLAALADQTDGVTYRAVDEQPKSALPAAVGDALFGLDKGALSNPIKTDDAWYLIRMTGQTAAKRPAFDDPQVQARLKAMAQDDAREKAFAEKSDTLEDLAYQAPNDLKTISKSLSLSPQTSEWITADGGPGIGQYDAVRDAAFSDAVVKDGLNSRVIKLGDTREIVLRVAEHEAAQPRDLADVAPVIRERIKTERAADKAKKSADQAVARLDAGDSLQSIAGDMKGTRLETPGYIGRRDNAVDPALNQAAFAIALEGQGDDSHGEDVATSSDGMPVVIAVSGQRLNDDADGSQKARKQQIAQQQRQYNASLENAAFDRYLVNQADIKIEKDSLKAGEADS